MPQDLRAGCTCQGSGGLGWGCGLWRRLGQEPHCFKPLVPVQLPNPSVHAAITRAVHTGTHRPDTCVRAHS